MGVELWGRGWDVRQQGCVIWRLGVCRLALHGFGLGGSAMADKYCKSPPHVTCTPTFSAAKTAYCVMQIKRHGQSSFLS